MMKKNILKTILCIGCITFLCSCGADKSAKYDERDEIEKESLQSDENETDMNYPIETTTENTKKETEKVTEKETESETTFTPVSYEELVGENSPILGYWQADNSSLYIDYLGEGENNYGFAIFVCSGMGGVKPALLNEYADWELSGNDREIQFGRSSEYEYQFTIQDYSHITMKDVSGTNTQFVKRELKKKDVEKFLGEWYVEFANDHEYKYVISFDDGLKYACYDPYGNCVYTNDDKINNVRYDNDSLKVRCLYNGTDELEFASIDDGYEAVNVYSRSFKMVDDGELVKVYSASPGDTSMHYMNKKGSRRIEQMKAVNAYKDYISANYGSEGKGYLLAYIDDDDIPELIMDVFGDGTSTVIFGYSNGIVKEREVYGRAGTFSYVKGKNLLSVVGYYSVSYDETKGYHYGTEEHSYGHMNNGMYVEDLKLIHETEYETGNERYSIGKDINIGIYMNDFDSYTGVSEEEYNRAIENFWGDEIDNIVSSRGVRAVYEAWYALNGEEEPVL